MIPRVAHMIWLGGPLPSRLAGLVATFRQHHPDWDLRWWHEADIDAFGLENRELYDAAADIVPADSVYQLRSDIARYEILYRHGGMYADCDYRWQRPIGPYLAGQDLVCAWEQQGQWAANGVIAAEPEHVALAAAMSGICYRARTKHPQWRANRVSGPHLWTPIAREHARILPQRLFNPAPWDAPERADREYRGAVAVHTWHHQRTLRGMDG